MSFSCSVCGGLAQSTETEPAFAHTSDCRIGQRVIQVRKLAEFTEQLERSSLGTPGAKAIRKIGRMYLEGKSHAQVRAALTPEEHAAADAEMALLDGPSLRRRS